MRRCDLAAALGRRMVGPRRFRDRARHGRKGHRCGAERPALRQEDTGFVSLALWITPLAPGSAGASSIWSTRRFAARSLHSGHGSRRIGKMVMVVENGVGTTAERPDGYAVKALIGSAMGYAMDGFDLLILAFLLGAIGADLGLTPAEAASLATWTLIGAVAGGVLFGLMADRFGRVRVLTWT